MIGAGSGSYEGSPYGVNGAGVGGEQGGMCRCEHGEMNSTDVRAGSMTTPSPAGEAEPEPQHALQPDEECVGGSLAAGGFRGSP